MYNPNFIHPTDVDLNEQDEIKMLNNVRTILFNIQEKCETNAKDIPKTPKELFNSEIVMGRLRYLDGCFQRVHESAEKFNLEKTKHYIEISLYRDMILTKIAYLIRLTLHCVSSAQLGITAEKQEEFMEIAKKYCPDISDYRQILKPFWERDKAYQEENREKNVKEKVDHVERHVEISPTEDKEEESLKDTYRLSKEDILKMYYQQVMSLRVQIDTLFDSRFNLHAVSDYGLVLERIMWKMDGVARLSAKALSSTDEDNPEIMRLTRAIRDSLVYLYSYLAYRVLVTRKGVNQLDKETLKQVAVRYKAFIYKWKGVPERTDDPQGTLYHHCMDVIKDVEQVWGIKVYYKRMTEIEVEELEQRFRKTCFDIFLSAEEDK